MENLPSPEQAKIERGDVAQILREKGKEDKEALEFLNKWLDQEQSRVEGGEISSLDLNVSWAELYRDAGLTEEAREAFTQAAEQAWQERNDDLYEKLQSEIEKL